jgi:MFS family permease
VTPPLDKTITDVMASLAVLLVFVVAFFSALLGPVDRAIAADFPSEAPARRDHLAKLSRIGALAVGFVLFSAGCFVVLMPLTSEALATWHWTIDGRFPTDRGVLLLIDVSMGVLVVAAGWLVVRIAHRYRSLRLVEQQPAGGG